jgi:type III secretory pathway component EscR
MSGTEDQLMNFWVNGLVQKPSAKHKGSPPLPTSSTTEAEKPIESAEDAEKAARAFETSLDGMKMIVKDALKRNKNMYTMLICVNLVIVAIGVGFVLISIVHSVLNNRIDEITLASAGLAVADFVAIFLVNPQDRMKKSLTNFVQLGILSHSWSSRIQASFILFLNSSKQQGDVTEFQTSIEKITRDTVDAIEEKVEK